MNTPNPTFNLRPRHSASQPINEFHAMYASEIDFVLVGLWDGGIDWFLGNGYAVENMVEAARAAGTFGNARNLEDALVQMTNAARAAYPQSDFARGRPTDIEVPTPYVTLGELIEKLAEISGSNPQIAYTPDPDPYIGNFTVAFEDGRIGYSGFSPEEAVHEAIIDHLPWTVVEDAGDGTWTVVAGNPVTNDPLLGFTVRVCPKDEAYALAQSHTPVTAPQDRAPVPTIDIVFDGPPATVSGRFVEVETPDGAGVRIGQWIDDPRHAAGYSRSLKAAWGGADLSAPWMAGS